ncbi:MAG: hypothetical protein ACLTXT_01960 [Ruminococcus callidus]
MATILHKCAVIVPAVVSSTSVDGVPDSPKQHSDLRRPPMAIAISH